MPIKCDVLVVGGGPAGLSTALLLSKRGYSTIILEKEKKCGPQFTKYDITEGNKLREIIKELNIKPNKILFRSEWISPKNNFILDSKIEDYYFKRGPENDSIENLLLEKLNKDKVFFNSKIISTETKKKKIISVKIRRDNKQIQIQPKNVISAEGPSSDFRERLKLKVNYFSKFNGNGIVFKTIKNDIIPHTRIYLNQEIAPGGYVYSGSVGNESFYCSVTDATLTKNTSSKESLKYFLDTKVDDKQKIKNYFEGFGISGIQEVQLENTIFVGGAALFYDPFLGYGMNYALESSYYAAKSIENDDYNIYNEYANRVQQDFKKSFEAREIFRNANNKFYDNLIKAFNGEYQNSDENIEKILSLFDE